MSLVQVLSCKCKSPVDQRVFKAPLSPMSLNPMSTIYIIIEENYANKYHDNDLPYHDPQKAQKKDEQVAESLAKWIKSYWHHNG